MRMAHTTSLDDTDQTIYNVRFVTRLSVTTINDLSLLYALCCFSVYFGLLIVCQFNIFGKTYGI